MRYEAAEVMDGSVETIWYSRTSPTDAVAVCVKPSEMSALPLFLPLLAFASRTVFSSVGIPVRFLGVKRHIVKPACVICGAGHRQGDEEGRSGLSDHFGDAGLDEEVQAKGKI